MNRIVLSHPITEVLLFSAQRVSKVKDSKLEVEVLFNSIFYKKSFLYLFLVRNSVVGMENLD